MGVHTKGIAWFILHCLLFAVLSAITKHLLEKIYVFEIIFIQTALATLFLIPVIAIKFRSQIHSHALKWHALRAFCWVMASSMYFYSVTHINLPKAVAISFSVPLFTTVLAVIFLKEKLQLQRVLALIFGVIGMLVIIRPGVGTYEPATLWVIGASFLWSLTDIMIKVLGKTHHAVVKTFYFAGFSAMFSLPLALTHWQMPDGESALWLILLSVLFAINIISVSKAYQNADLTIIMPFSFTQLIFIAILAYFMFDEVMSLSTLAGSIIIIGSTSFMSYRERQIHKQFLAQQMGKKFITNNLR